jgi:hypothetical protein
MDLKINDASLTLLEVVRGESVCREGLEEGPGLGYKVVFTY